MTEKEKADAGSKEWHPIMRLFIENPISALNTAVFIFGGGMVYSKIVSYMAENDARVGRIEQQLRETSATANVKDDRTTVRVETISRDLGDLKVTVGRVDAAVNYLVQQAREDRARDNRRTP